MKVSFIRLSIASLFVAIASNVLASIPAGYYSSLNGKSESALKTALYQIISNHNTVSSYSNLPNYFEKTDVYPGTNRWWDMYSDIPLYLPWSGSTLNREHCLPKSWWGGDTSTPAYIDLFHLYPSEAIANQRKSNYPLGEVVGTPYYTNGFIKVGKGVNSGGMQYVFEPNDEYKGDFARTYFYMVTCYQTMNWVNTCQVMNGVYPSLQTWAQELLLQWHRQDPVSEKEINRNEKVYGYQQNRNPFIDHPELAEYIWGNMKGQPYNPGTTPEAGNGEIITPQNNSTLDFTQVAVNHPSTSTLLVKGNKLTKNLEITVTGTNRSYFSVSQSSISSTLANSTSGATITVTYNPTTVGSHTANLIIENPSVDGTLKVVLIGEALPEPTLTAPTATEATNVTDKAYTANWTSPANETVDYYMVTVKRYKNNVVTTQQLAAETDSLDIDGLDLADFDTYAVQSVRLNISSPLSNYVTVRPVSALEQIIADQPLVVESYPGMIRLRCSAPHTDVRFYDVAGRLVTALPQIDDYHELQLPAGAYFLTTSQHPRPIKCIAR